MVQQLRTALWRTSIWSSALTWWFTTAWNSSSTGSDILFWPQKTPVCVHAHIHKINGFFRLKNQLSKFDHSYHSSFHPGTILNDPWLGCCGSLKYVESYSQGFSPPQAGPCKSNRTILLIRWFTSLLCTKSSNSMASHLEEEPEYLAVLAWDTPQLSCRLNPCLSSAVNAVKDA